MLLIERLLMSPHPSESKPAATRYSSAVCSSSHALRPAKRSTRHNTFARTADQGLVGRLVGHKAFCDPVVQSEHSVPLARAETQSVNQRSIDNEIVAATPEHPVLVDPVEIECQHPLRPDRGFTGDEVRKAVVRQNFLYFGGERLRAHLRIVRASKYDQQVDA